jgi:hypothetical protein
MTMTLFIASIAAAGGFALCWFAKERILVAVNGAESTIRKCEARIAALRAAL